MSLSIICNFSFKLDMISASIKARRLPPQVRSLPFIHVAALSRLPQGAADTAGDWRICVIFQILFFFFFLSPICTCLLER